MGAPSRVINVLDEDPGLGEHIAEPRLQAARRAAATRLLVVAVGEWRPRENALTGDGALGVLVLDGVLTRKVSMGGRAGLELFGAGDLLGPEDEMSPQLRHPPEVRWWALRPTRLAVLDARFARRMCAYPEVLDELSRRFERRSSTHALRFAIMAQPHLAERLRLLLWHLADRFGRVHPDGVVVDLPLAHGLLAELVGARRPSVSRALKELERGGVVARRRDGSWLLARNAPPQDGG